MPQDRTLSILCTFIGFYRPSDGGYGGNMSYAITGSNPPMGNVVLPTGEIDISNAPPFDPAVYNATVDITFSLAGYCALQDGTHVPVTWSSEMSNNPQGLPAMLLLEEDQTTPASTNEVEAGWVPGSNNTQIFVDDKDETKNYYFRPAIIVPALNGYYISCDPPLVNRTRGGK
jgi:hypothetical protein